MSQTERIAYLDRRLRERGWVTAHEAAAHFEVSPRQIKRDIEYLRWRLDAPVVYDAPHRRYRYRETFSKLRFADERRVLFSALVRGWAASEASQDLVTPEILEATAAAVARDYRAVAERIRFEAPTTETVDLETFSALCRGIRDQRVVELDYVNVAGEASRRRVEVERLIHYLGVWYLVGFDHLRQALRTFHLGRIRSLALTSEATSHSTHDTQWQHAVEMWIESGSGIFRGGEEFLATVRLRGMALRLAQNQRWHARQSDVPSREPTDTWIDRTLPVVDTRELLSRVLAYGADAEVVAPQEFRQRWLDEIRRLSDFLISRP